MTLQEILAAILNPNGGGQQNQLAMAGAPPAQVGDHANPALLPQFAAPQAAQAPQQALAPPQAQQGQPMPQGAPQATPVAAPAPSGGGIGGFLSNLLQGPQAAQKSETVGWLKKQGMDDGTAIMLASSKPALQQYLLAHSQGKKPIEINGRLVDPTDYHVIADFSDKKDGDKPPASYQEYQLAKQDGFNGTYTDWQTKSVREQDPTFGREKDLRQEYELTPIVKNYQIVRDNYERIRQGASIGTGAGDLAIIFGYMKMLDPTSVVREGEQAAASDVSGVPSKILNLYNAVVAGAKLPPEARTELLGAATHVYSESSKNLDDLNKRYGGIATNYKLDPSRIVQPPEAYDPIVPPVSTNGDLPMPPPEAAPQTGYTPGAPAAVTPGGQRVIEQMTNPAPVKDWKDWFKKGN